MHAGPQYDEPGGQVVINTPANVRRMARVIREAGVLPEIELFDSGDIALLADLLQDGTLEGPVLASIVIGGPLRLPAQPRNRGLRKVASAREFQVHRGRGSADGRFPASPHHIWQADISGSDWRTRFTSAGASSPPPTPPW